jgi:hypothetical protein
MAVIVLLRQELNDRVKKMEESGALGKRKDVYRFLMRAVLTREAICSAGT